MHPYYTAREFSPVLIKTPSFEVKIASSLEEIEAALRLRFEVFNLEMQEGLESSYETGFDSDVYDTFCDHLIVKENSSQRVVGTYRLLRQEKAEKNIGFYSECEFDLSNLKSLSGQSLEVGRSCVAQKYRSIAVINLLWSGIARYMDIFRTERLFGCASLHTKNIEDISLLSAFLTKNFSAPGTYRVYPRAQHAMALLSCHLNEEKKRFAFKLLPPLLKGYLRLGAMVCGGPALDKEFRTVDFLVVVENDRITERYKKHYTEHLPQM